MTDKGIDKAQVEQADDVSPGQRPNLQPPELLQGMGHQERQDLEARVRRKIDFRLLPMMVLMYVMNYIDRYVRSLSSVYPPLTVIVQQ